MINNRSIYYWISEFRNSLRDYKGSLDNVKEGLDYHPGDNYLENLKLRTLIVASEDNIAYETEAIEMLDGIRLKYPSDLRITVELLKLLKRRKTDNELLPLILESFESQNYRIEPEAVRDLKIEEIIFILEDLETLFKFRNTSNLGQLFFERYNISIAKFQLIEMKANFLFLKLNGKMHFTQSDAIISLFQQQVQEFLSFCEYCTEILVSELADNTVEAKAELITKIITTLPEILLIELSRQNGWLLQVNGHPVELADQFINTTDSIKEWFDQCLIPILMGANNVFKWSKEDNQEFPTKP